MLEQIPKDSEMPPLSKPERIEFLKRLIFDFSNQIKEPGLEKDRKTLEGMVARYKEELDTLEQP